MRRLAIAYGNNRQAKTWTNKMIIFDELKECLKVTIRTPESVEEYAKFNKAKRDTVKDHGGFVAAEEKMKLARLEFKLPPLLTDMEIEEVLTVLPDLTKWANEITAYATDAAINHGKDWNGFKVVKARSNRKYRDELLVAEAAKKHGYTDIYRQSLIPMTEMQKLMGKSTFEEILGDLIYKPPGKLTLVSSTDKRPAMNVTNAENEFNEIMED